MKGLNLPLVLIIFAAIVYFFGQVQEVPDGLPPQITTNFRNDESKSYFVTVRDGKYWINGLCRPNLVVNRGQTYFFNFTTPSTRAHPFYLSTENDKGGSENYNGELGNHQGVYGSRMTTGQLIWEVPRGMPPGDVYYHCGMHPDMGARITVR